MPKSDCGKGKGVKEGEREKRKEEVFSDGQTNFDATSTTAATAGAGVPLAAAAAFAPPPSCSSVSSPSACNVPRARGGRGREIRAMNSKMRWGLRRGLSKSPAASLLLFSTLHSFLLCMHNSPPPSVLSWGLALPSPLPPLKGGGVVGGESVCKSNDTERR